MKSLFSNPYVTLISRLILGTVFIIASIEKISDPEGFAGSIQAYELMPISIINLLAIVLPWIELVCGLFLVGGILVRANAIVLSGMLIVFMAGISTAMARGLNIDCGCFGSAHATPVGWPRFIEDGGLLVLGVQLYLYPKSALSLQPSTPELSEQPATVSTVG